MLPAIVLLSLLGTGVAQAFCFLKNKDRGASYSNSRMPAIGFSPAVYQGYPYRPLQPGWYGYQTVAPQQLPYDNRYLTTESGLQH
jgi:hypothetical protein